MHWNDPRTYTGRTFDLETGATEWHAPDGTTVPLDHEVYIGAGRHRIGLHFASGALGIAPMGNHKPAPEDLGRAVLSLMREDGNTSLIAVRHNVEPDAVAIWERRKAGPKAGADMAAIVAQRALLRFARRVLLPNVPNPDEWLGVVPDIDNEWREALPEGMQTAKRRYVLILPRQEAGHLQKTVESNGAGAGWSLSSLGRPLGTFDVMAASVAFYSAAVTQPILFPVPALCFAYEEGVDASGGTRVTVGAVPTEAIAHARVFGRKSEALEAMEAAEATIAEEQRQAALVAPRAHELITDRQSLKARMAARRRLRAESEG